jgi:hypothetical protein
LALPNAKLNAARPPRDQLYYLAAQRAVRAGQFVEALALTEKMSSRNSHQAHGLIVFEIAQKELEAGHLEDARRLIVDEADLVWRAYLLMRIAVHYLDNSHKDVQRGTDILTEIVALLANLSRGSKKPWFKRTLRLATHGLSRDGRLKPYAIL